MQNELIKPDSSAVVQKLSILSVDMGIRNLAYAHFLVDPSIMGQPAKLSGPSGCSRPILADWKRVVISGDPNNTITSAKRRAKPQRTSDAITTDLATTEEAPTGTLLSKVEKEAFDPITFANYAYRFIIDVLLTHEPTHVLIERQRFRSGGGSAVQEWTIRVGVFEGMLHAVLKTLSQEKDLGISVQSIDPGRVTRYWLQGLDSPGRRHLGSAKESKKAKIDIVGNSFKDRGATLVDVQSEKAGQEVKIVIDAFLARWKNPKSSKKAGNMNDLVKLDDLSDCFLQGIAWLNWQQKRREVIRDGGEAFAGDPIFESVGKTRSGMDPKGGIAAKKNATAPRRTPRNSKSNHSKTTV